MKLSDLLENPSYLEEGPIADRIKKAALSGAVAASLGTGYLATRPDAVPQPTPITQPAPATTAPAAKPTAKIAPEYDSKRANQIAIAKLSLPRVSKVSDNTDEEQLLIRTAQAAGIKSIELAAFLAQCNHESAGFDRMKERGGKEYFASKYDPQHAPTTAKILGNVKAGDGVKYHGRGFIQLTGRDNYRMAGAALGLDLLKHPELAEKPKIAAKIAVWFWKSRVRPAVNDFTNQKEVTSKINPAMRNFEARQSSFERYLRLI
jgi:predicted chitinase